MTRLLVSVLTPTWRRPDDLKGAIETVRGQTYRPLEHCIVIDGPDDGATRDLAWLQQQVSHAERHPLIRYLELGRNWSTYLPASFCAAPTTVAMLLARGAYQTWLADDERMAPDHVEALVDLLESSGADFVYSAVEMSHVARPGERWVIGRYPPECGQITNVLYRAELLRHGLFVFGGGGIGDWRTIERWMQAGARSAMLDRVTLTHRADH